MSELAFRFLQSAISAEFPAWKAGWHYYGITRLSAENWYAILSALDGLRFDIRAGVHPKLILARAFIPLAARLHRRATLAFLDQFEIRVRTVVAQYPYLLIAGI
ncbi:hypothetical protein ABI_23890 [Asticcacaulis biprosthecium C19]|uniref:Uncharacterized protein n=2 Tax=Asticcacaulis biprosthecium TaxID=76891 RepID=F4QNR8_9CAUL|nr:hypothetical protein ABI_23890 [Asticcacaulis biprosthecium C19]